MEHIRAADLVELLFEIVKADYGAGSAGFIGSNAAECDDIFDARILYCGRDGVADLVRITERVFAGGVRGNHDIGGVGLVEGFGESLGIGDICDERLSTLRGEGL